MTIRLAAAFVLVSLVLAASPALAQTDFDRTTARTLGQEGHAALDRKDFVTAADRFSRADALVHAPTFLLGFAEAEVGLGKLVAALEAYNKILREGLPPKAPPAFAKAVETARQEFDALQPRIPYVTVQVAGPAAASVKVTIDGADVPRAALGVKRAVDPGEHTVVAVADGFSPAKATVVVAEGRTESITLEPKPGPPGAIPPPPPGVAVATPPPAQQGSGSGSLRRKLGIAGMAIGGVGLVVGAAMGGAVIAKHGSLTQSCPGGKCMLSQQATLQPQVNQYHAFSAASTAGFVIGGVFAVTGIVLFATAPKPSTPAVGLVVGPGFGGVEGTFQ